MRSELTAAWKQVSNLEEKMKDVLQISAIKDHLISNLEKRLTQRQAHKNRPHLFWKY